MIRLFLILFFTPLLAEITPVDIPVEIVQNDAETLHLSNNTVIGNSADDYQRLFLRTAIMIIVVIGLGVTTVWMVRRFSLVRQSSGNHTSYIKVIERRSLSPKSMMYLIQLGDKKILITESQINIKAKVIDSIDAREPDADDC